jgi:hypothetical protein
MIILKIRKFHSLLTGIGTGSPSRRNLVAKKPLKKIRSSTDFCRKKE